MATAAIARRLGAAGARTAGTSAMSADPPLPHSDLVAAIPRLRRYARVLTGDATRADDLVQETLARGWEKRRLWAAGTDLRAWLFTIMHNVFVNQRATNVRDAQNVSLDGSSTWNPLTWFGALRGERAWTSLRPEIRGSAQADGGN